MLQVLSTRKRKDVKVEDVQVKARFMLTSHVIAQDISAAIVTAALLQVIDASSLLSSAAWYDAAERARSMTCWDAASADRRRQAIEP